MTYTTPPVALLLLGTFSVVFVIGIVIRTVLEPHTSRVKKLSSIMLWSCIAFVSFFPEMSKVWASLLGLGTSLNTPFFIAIVVQFALIYLILKRIDGLQKQLSEIVRELAIKEKKGSP